MNKAFGPKRSKGFRNKYLAPVLVAAAFLLSLSCQAQFPTTDSLHRYNNRYINKSAVEAFQNLRLNTLLHGIISWIDSARTGAGGTLGIDTLYAINDSTVRYRKNGVYHTFAVNGVYDSRRKVDSVFAFNDSILRVVINGEPRDVKIRGIGTGGQVGPDQDSIRVVKISGYSVAFLLSDLGDNDWVTKKNLTDAIAEIVVGGGNDDWGNQVVISDSTLGYTTGVAADTLRVNRTMFYTRHEVDSIKAGIISGGGNDNWGTDTVVHDLTLKGRGNTFSPLRSDTTKLVTYRAMDSLKNALPGTDKFPAVDTANISVLGDFPRAFPSSRVVKNYIDAISVAAGTTLTGWFNVLQYGAVANGTFSSGTDLSAVIQNIITIAPNNSVVFIPTGTYRCLSAITWPTTKRLFLVSYGDLIFNSSNGFIIDCLNRPIIWSYGSVFGTDQSGNPVNYGSQTNIGFNIRNSRNSEVHINVVSGFKVAIRCGGDGGGNQYNRIWFNNLNRNSVGIEMYAGGVTTNGARWSNDNTFYGGQISADTGLIFRKDPTPGDYFNGNTFYNFGFEYAGNQVPMRAAIVGDHGSNNIFYHYRIEPNGVTDAFNFTQDFIGAQHYGVYLQDAWLDHMGAAPYITGIIYGDNGDILGNVATGYFYSSTNTYYNERIKITGTKRSPSGASLVHANIDIDWTNETYTTVTSSAYTVAAGIKMVFVNNAATSTITLPTVASSGDKLVTVKNKGTTNNVVVAPVGTVLGPGVAATFGNDRVTWFDVSQKPITTGTGGSGGQWDSIAPAQIAYNGMVGIGFSGVPGALADVGAGNTSRPGLRVRQGPPTTSPLNGAIEPITDGRWLGTTNSIRKQFLMAPYGALVPKQTIQVNSAGTDAEYIWPNYILFFNQNFTTTIANTTTATSLYGGASSVPKPIAATDELTQTGGGIINATGTTPNISFIIRYNGATAYTFVLPALVGGRQYLYTYTLNSSVRTTGTSAPVYTDGQIVLYDNTTAAAPFVLPLILNGGGAMNTSAPTCDIQMQWSAAAAGNSILSIKNKAVIQSQN